MIRMINTFRRYLLVLIIAAAPSLIFAQNNFVADVSDSTDIKGQFEYLFNKSNTYEQYKVVQISGYNTLKKNAIDSLQMYKEKAINHLNEINTLNTNITTSNAEIKQLREELETTQNIQNSIKLLGMELSKKTYNSIMWGLISCLAILAAILHMRFKRGHHIVKETRIRVTELQEDLERLRQNALLREQKLGRELMSLKSKNK